MTYLSYQKVKTCSLLLLIVMQNVFGNEMAGDANPLNLCIIKNKNKSLCNTQSVSEFFFCFFVFFHWCSGLNCLKTRDEVGFLIQVCKLQCILIHSHLPVHVMF